jgi:hypothetical protein
MRIMFWLALGIAVAVSFFHNFVQKYLANTIASIRIALWMFGVAATSAVLVHVVLYQTLIFHDLALRIAAMAALNSLAAWMFIAAIRRSMTKTTLTVPLVTSISVFLVVFFLGESSLLDPRTFSGFMLLTGTVLCIFAMILFGASSKTPSRESSVQTLTPKERMTWLLLVSGATLCWGIINSLLKYVAIKDVAVDQFLLPWYMGAFVTIAMLSALHRQTSQPILVTGAAHNYHLPSRLLYPALILLGLLTIGSLGSVFWALTLGPGVIALTINDIGRVTGGTLLGLLYFKEKDSMRHQDWAGLAIGAVGVVLIISSSLFR